MYFVVLATDYDGTLAKEGRVNAATIDALKEVRSSGRKLILVTGRDLPDLQRVFPQLELFDLVVAENGALLFDPAKKEETPLAEPPLPAFVARLRELGVSPLSVGRTIVATREPNEAAVLKAIGDLAIEQHIVFNKGAVMVLPGNVNKAWGLKRALKRLCLSLHNVVGIGDAENDQAFLSACGCAVAVDNALPTVKSKADLVVADHGDGVIELARLLTEADLRSKEMRIPRVQPVLGIGADKTPVCLSPFSTTLITGSSGAGKSTIVTAVLEQMRDLAFQFCVVDPEGDYSEFPDAVVVGDAKQEPRIAEVTTLLAKPDVSVVSADHRLVVRLATDLSFCNSPSKLFDLDLDDLLHPAGAFSHPRDAISDSDLTLNEKRAILASWASDACAIEGAPALRSPPGISRRYQSMTSWKPCA